MSTEKYRGRIHMLLLYPENEQHVAAMEKIAKSYDYAAIQHDRDKWTEEDEEKNPGHKAGEAKKAHWHIVLRTQNATWNTALCKELGIEERLCEQAKNCDRALQYLIHYNDTDKTKYDIEEVFGTMAGKLKESINREEKTESEKILGILEHIDTYDKPISVRHLAGWCAENGYWSEFRRAGSIILKIAEEHNEMYRERPQLQCGELEDAKSKARFEGYIQGSSDRRTGA